MPTISDVARRAGVSTVTVSRVINAAPNVNSATREKVQQAIEELGYVPNVVARSLRSKRTRALALLVPDITNAFWTTIARGVEDAAQSQGYSVLLCNTDENPGKQARYLHVVASQRVDGVVIAPYDSNLANLAELRGRGVPAVVIDRRVNGWNGDSVTCDSVASGRALVRYLIGQRRRRIAIVSGPKDTSTAEDRVLGYSLALAEAGLSADERLIRRGEFRVSDGERLIGDLLDARQAIDAVFAANNAIALGVIQGLEQRGQRVPEDVAIVCMDDLPNAERCFPFLTVAVQPAYEMGAQAANLLLTRLDRRSADAPALPAQQVILPTRLIIRGERPRTVVVPPLSAAERRELSGPIAAPAG